MYFLFSFSVRWCLFDTINFIAFSAPPYSEIIYLLIQVFKEQFDCNVCHINLPSLFIPIWRHFFNLHAWHWFRCALSTMHRPVPAWHLQLYVENGNSAIRRDLRSINVRATNIGHCVGLIVCGRNHGTISIFIEHVRLNWMADDAPRTTVSIILLSISADVSVCTMRYWIVMMIKLNRGDCTGRRFCTFARTRWHEHRINCFAELAFIADPKHVNGRQRFIWLLTMFAAAARMEKVLLSNGLSIWQYFTYFRRQKRTIESW